MPNNNEYPLYNQYIYKDGIGWVMIGGGGGDSLPDQTGNNGKFLTTNGTNVSWGRVSPNVPYLTCSTAQGTVAKTTTLVSGTFTSADLVEGAQVLVKFTSANTSTNPTIDINGTGAKPIRRYGTTAAGTSGASSWNAGAIVSLIYDGTAWYIEGWENTIYSGMTDAEYQAGTSTSNRLITPARLKAAIQTWAPTELPDQTNNNGKFLTTNGTNVSWTDIDEDDHKWNDVQLIKTSSLSQSDIYLPYLSSTDATFAEVVATSASNTGANAANKIPKYNNSGYLISTTPGASDNSTKVATTAYVKSVVPTKVSDLTNDSGYIASSSIGVANGVAELDANGLVPSNQLPSYVDDVLEYSALSNFPATGETGKIYVDTGTNLTYRWSGTQYIEISKSLALGETSSTAYRGDRGKTAYTHATDSNRLTTAKNEALYKIATTAEGHVKSVTAVAKADITALGIPAQDTTYTFDGDYNASTNKAATVSTVTNAINALDVASSGTGAITGFGAGKTLATLYETNGKISATFQNISITKSQITDFPTALAPTAHTHTVSITPTTSSIYQITNVGSVTSGKSGSVTTLNLSKFNGGSFTPGTDSFTAAAFQTGFYSVGNAGSVTTLNLSKFSGGSYTHTGFNGGSYSHTGFNGGSFTRGTFSGGSFVRGAFTGGSFTQGSDSFSSATLVMSMDSTDTKKCIISFGGGSFTQGSDSFTAATHAADTFTAATHGNDSFTAATYGTDTFTSATYGTDTFTPAAFQSGFYSVGNAGSVTTLNLSKFSGGSFTQGTDTFTSAAFGTGFYSVGTPATPTVVTLPTRASVTVWTGVSSAVANANN